MDLRRDPDPTRREERRSPENVGQRFFGMPSRRETQLQFHEVPDAAGHEQPVASLIPADLRVDHVARTDRVIVAVRDLRPRVAECLVLYYARELTLAEVGGKLGVTESAASKIIRDGLDRIRKKIARPRPEGGWTLRPDSVK
jgi:DNA-directed RNA polymerase specialized sigma24 family protein